MARFRLLSNLSKDRKRLLTAVAVLVLIGLGSCAIGPIYARRVEGKVVDKRTGVPVAGAEVFASYPVTVPAGHSYEIGHRWATTGNDGRFAIPAHIAVTLGPPISWTRKYPTFDVVHRDYGVFGFSYGKSADKFPGWRNLVFEIEPEISRGLFENTLHWASLCRGMPRKACDRMCMVAYGSVEPCKKGRGDD